MVLIPVSQEILCSVEATSLFHDADDDDDEVKERQRHQQLLLATLFYLRYQPL
jgi:hypothetical protein